MKPLRCSGCSIDNNFADDPPSFSFLCGLTEAACNSIDDIVSGLCPAHRLAYDRLLKVTKETMESIAAERAKDDAERN